MAQTSKLQILNQNKLFTDLISSSDRFKLLYETLEEVTKTVAYEYEHIDLASLT